MDGALVKYRKGAADWATDREEISIPTDILERVGNAQFSPIRPAFYSQLERAIEGVPDRLATMAAPQWRLWLDANASKMCVKKDEVEWSGIERMLTQRERDKLSREDVAAFVAAKAPRIELLRRYAHGEPSIKLAAEIAVTDSLVVATHRSNSKGNVIGMRLCEI